MVQMHQPYQTTKVVDKANKRRYELHPKHLRESETMVCVCVCVKHVNLRSNPKSIAKGLECEQLSSHLLKSMYGNPHKSQHLANVSIMGSSCMIILNKHGSTQFMQRVKCPLTFKNSKALWTKRLTKRLDVFGPTQQRMLLQ